MPIMPVGQIGVKNTVEIVAADIPNEEMPVSLGRCQNARRH